MHNVDRALYILVCIMWLYCCVVVSQLLQTENLIKSKTLCLLCLILNWAIAKDYKYNLISWTEWLLQDIFEGLRKCDELANSQVKFGVSLDNKDLEYLEAASLLHNIGLFISKKGYHKKSCEIIMVHALFFQWDVYLRRMLLCVCNISDSSWLLKKYVNTHWLLRTT